MKYLKLYLFYHLYILIENTIKKGKTITKLNPNSNPNPKFKTIIYTNILVNLQLGIN
jgi:hypothetical protein